MKQKTKKLNPQIEKALKNKTILITGGAGSVGAQLTSRLLDYSVKTVRVLDINENGLFQ